MDEARRVQTALKTNDNFNSLMSSSSAMAMEVKRKKIRQSAVFHQTEITNVQEKLDFEMRMRDGAYKLLLACSKREQVLNASKNLMTCNARVKAYLNALQRSKEEQGTMGSKARSLDSASNYRTPCRGTVALSGLRIPLLWKDSDHFDNKGSSRRVAVFCSLLMGSQVLDTDMALVDRAVTDICFEGVAVFQEATPQFQLKVELWGCALDEELTLAKTPKKLAKKLRSSFGKSSGKKLRPPVGPQDPDAFLQHHPLPPGSRYSLLAYTTLSLSEADGTFLSHSLVVLQSADWSSWLPLYGNVCCRLVARPVCMSRSVMSGSLNQRQSVGGRSHCCSLHCVLSAGLLSCYFTPQEILARVEPTLNVPVNKDTRIRLMEKTTGGHKSRSLCIINPSHTVHFTSDTSEDLDAWTDALHQHLYDQDQWLHCCHQLLEVEVGSPRKPSLFLSKQADCVYNDLSINSPVKCEGIADIIHNKIEATGGSFLIGHGKEREAPDWSSLFDGRHSAVVHKSQSSTPFSSPTLSTNSTPVSHKKRRAPPPPPDREPYTPPPPTPHLEKENCSAPRPPARSKTGRPSLDAKFSAIVQQLQRSHAGAGAARKHAPLGRVEVQPPPCTQTPQTTADHSRPVRATNGPLPAPLPAPGNKFRKSFRGRMNLKML